MNHQKIYESIIQNARSKDRKKLRKNNLEYVYYENHHIIPRCINGSDNDENRVLLTAREHFVCHKLLTYIYKGNRGIALAFHRMTFSKKHNGLVSARDYAYATEIFKSTPVSEITKQKHRDWNKVFYSKKENRDKCSQLGEKNGMFGKIGSMKGKKHSKETKQKQSIWQKGKTYEEKFGKEKAIELREQKSESMKREGNFFFGKHHSKETVQILKEKKRKHLIPVEIIEIIKKDRTSMKFNDLQIKYSEYKRTTLQRIVAGEYDKGYYEVKSK